MPCRLRRLLPALHPPLFANSAVQSSLCGLILPTAGLRRYIDGSWYSDKFVVGEVLTSMDCGAPIRVVMQRAIGV